MLKPTESEDLQAPFNSQIFQIANLLSEPISKLVSTPGKGKHYLLWSSLWLCSVH